MRRLQLTGALGLLLLWEGLSFSGLFYRGVLPSTVQIGAALANMLAQPSFWPHALTTLGEVLGALAIGATLGLVVGILVGGTLLSRRAYEPALHYLAPTPKIVFLPILITLFGVGPASKVAMGALSCFFPVVLSVISGMTQVSPVHLRVARGFGLSQWRTIRAVYLPSLVRPAITGLRLGLGVAVIGCLLSEIKLSNRGLGFLAIQYYGQFRIPEMYAVLIVIFAFAGAGNALLSRVRLPGSAVRGDAPASSRSVA